MGNQESSGSQQAPVHQRGKTALALPTEDGKDHGDAALHSRHKSASTSRLRASSQAEYLQKMTTFFERRYTGQSGSQPARGKLQPRQGGGQSHTSASATGAATPKGQHFAERMGFWHDMLRVVGGLESDDDEESEASCSEPAEHGDVAGDARKAAAEAGVKAAVSSVSGGLSDEMKRRLSAPVSAVSPVPPAEEVDASKAKARTASVTSGHQIRELMTDVVADAADHRKDGEDKMVIMVAGSQLPVIVSQDDRARARSKKRLKVLQEIIASEELYSRFLTILVDKFIVPMAVVVPPDKMVAIFCNIQSIAPFHNMIAQELGTRGVVATMQKYAPFLKMYTPYVNNYENALQTLASLKNNRPFQEFLADVKRDPDIGGLDFMSYLIMPIQRIPRYRMLLEQLKKYTEESHSDWPMLLDALDKVCEVADSVNESKREIENLTRMVEVQNRISGRTDVELLQPHRHLVRESPIIRKQKRSMKAHAFLFNDLFLWTTPAPAFRFKGVTPLANVSVTPFQHKARVGFEVVCSGLNQPLRFICPPEDRDSWISALNESIAFATQAAERKKKRMHAKRQNLHSNIASQLKSLTGTMKKRLLKQDLDALAAQFAEEEEEEAQPAPGAVDKDNSQLRMHARVNRSRAHSSAARRRGASSASLSQAHLRADSELPTARVETDTDDEQKDVVDSDQEDEVASHFLSDRRMPAKLYGLQRPAEPEDPAMKAARLQQQAANLHRRQQMQRMSMQRATSDPL